MKKFIAYYTDEALAQYEKLDKISKKKLTVAVGIFEQIGTEYKNINTLGDGLFELKPDNIRAYFKYSDDKIIIIGLVALKKTKKAPIHYKEKAVKNIENI